MSQNVQTNYSLEVQGLKYTLATSGLVEVEGCCSCTSASSTPPHAFLSSTPEILDFRASLMIKCSSHIVLAGFELEFYWGNEPISLYIQKEPFCDLFRRHKTEDRRMNYAMPSF